ncbi:molybdenum cofactor biosynthesis protein MoaE [Neomegalonema sp.]|uniref:molybdenum cofactor biosynthesis protein MoaE n=1 Tax=Neomegalonema sp. TaxID=2039713 RepID=UPI00262608EE|nr:molybdenum cofactor biosynthesis protein MoaE [Neomegalonema sp.]MDD2868150.1 molybdenum cofactor biosynthesis protein MoaE [Neomegalonema sp.]
MAVRVQAEDFDPAAELEALAAEAGAAGAVVSFLGHVRGEKGSVAALTLEHYPGMAERALEALEAEARRRWALEGCRIVHRHGRLTPGERIVMVATASPHRRDAFESAAFLMDRLKTDAPFWKREEGPQGARWIEAREADARARDRWSPDR